MLPDYHMIAKWAILELLMIFNLFISRHDGARNTGISFDTFVLVVAATAVSVEFYSYSRVVQ